MRQVRPLPAQRSAIVIVAVLVIVSLLALAAYQFSDLMVQEYRAADSAARAQQARALADSGVNYAAAILANPDTMSGLLSGNPYDNATVFQNVTLNPNETNARRQGSFSIFAPLDPDAASSSGQTMRFGVIDEASKINLNALLQLDPSGEVAFDMLMKLPNMTEEIADAIIDWIDSDDEQRTSGAESSYYSGLTPGYMCKNGTLDSLEELLLVKGVTPDLLFGTDRNRNGIEDAGEDSGAGWSPGWATYLTIYSRERNVDSTGAPRTFLNEPDLKTSYEALKAAVGDALANYIILYRTQQRSAGTTNSTATITTGGSGGNIVMVMSIGNLPASLEQIQAKVDEVLQNTQTRANSLSSRFELLNSSVNWTIPSGRNQQTIQMASPLNDASQLRQLLPILLDKTTTQQTAELPARVNVLTASRSVLAALPALTEEDVQSIMDHRPAPGSESSDPVYQTTAWLLTDASLTIDKLRALERYVTARTQVYRVQVLGHFDQGGPVARVEAIIDTNNGKPRIVMHRDLSDLGRGLNLNQ